MINPLMQAFVWPIQFRRGALIKGLVTHKLVPKVSYLGAVVPHQTGARPPLDGDAVVKEVAKHANATLSSNPWQSSPNLVAYQSSIPALSSLEAAESFCPEDSRQAPDLPEYVFPANFLSSHGPSSSGLAFECSDESIDNVDWLTRGLAQDWPEQLASTVPSLQRPAPDDCGYSSCLQGGSPPTMDLNQSRRIMEMSLEYPKHGRQDASCLPQLIANSSASHKLPQPSSPCLEQSLTVQSTSIQTELRVPGLPLPDQNPWVRFKPHFLELL